MDWFRSYHGAPTDAKWVAVGRRAGVAPGVVAAMWWALLDHASQASPRGSVADFDVEAVAAFFGWDETQCNAVLVTLREKRMIDAQDMLRAWGKRNPKREDDSTPRVRKHREHKRLPDTAEGVTPRNAVKRNETLEKIREEESKDVASSSGRAHAVREIVKAANEGMAANERIGIRLKPIEASGSAQQHVGDWLAAGIPPPLIADTVRRVASQYTPDRPGQQISTMRYFDNAVQDAFTKAGLNGAGNVGDTERGGTAPKRSKFGHLVEGGGSAA